MIAATTRTAREQADGVVTMNRLRPLDLPARVKAPGGARNGVGCAYGSRVDQARAWLCSAAVGFPDLPHKASSMCSTVPSSCHHVKYQYRVGQGAKSFGSCRHAHPVRMT